MIELQEKSRYGESAEIFGSYSDIRIDRLFENLEYYRDKALDLACEKILLEGLCKGCEPGSNEYCSIARKLIDNE